MFQQFKNIDTAFKFIRLFCIVFVLSTLSLSVFCIYRSTSLLSKGQSRIYVISNGKLMEALAVERRDSLSVEVRDHVKMFHFYFYSLVPDNAANSRRINAAFNLADSCAYHEYKNLQEKSYYAYIISGNINQEVLDYDSISVDIDHSPWHFIYYGKLRLTRPSSILTRSLVTEGYVRETAISDRNPHGFLIENWKVLDNRDLSIEKR